MDRGKTVSLILTLSLSACGMNQTVVRAAGGKVKQIGTDTHTDTDTDNDPANGAPSNPKLPTAPITPKQLPNVIGVVANTNSTTGNGTQLAPVLDKALTVMNVKSVRIWFSIIGWSRVWPASKDANTASKAITWQDGVKAARRYKASGYHVLAAVVGEDGAVPPDAKSAANQLSYLYDAEGLNLKAAVDIWEIGNEPDHAEYWRGGSVSSYVDKFLVPAAVFFKSRGAKVLTGAPSYNPDDVRTIVTRLKQWRGPDLAKIAAEQNVTIKNFDTRNVANTAFDLVDYVGYHPYVPLNDLPKKIKEVQDYASPKPLIASEWWVKSQDKPWWNVHDKNGCIVNMAAWNEENALGFPIITKGFAYSYFYALSPSDSGGPVSKCNSLLTLDNAPRAAFNWFKDVARGY